MRVVGLRRMVVVIVGMLFTCVAFAVSQSNAQKRSKEPTVKHELVAAQPDATAPSDEAARIPDNNAPKDALENFKFRNLGPAAGGGRVTSVVGVPGKPNIYYAGAAAGGVFKTTDGGLSWSAIFEKQPVASIGAIALAPSNSNMVWVGTGEANIRNDVSTGHGVYFSPDGGASWQFKGLKDVGQISSIVIDPINPNTVFVGAIGHAWGPNAERGVFRTTDAGKTWHKVLYIDTTTGVSSLVMSPDSPMVLYAGMWQIQRFPWMMLSGGNSSGIFRSTDGGNTWKRLTEGLPEGPLGRIGLAASQSNPKHVYALVEAKKGLLWDTLDYGDHWREVSNNHVLDARPFYFSTLAVSPQDESRVYFLSFNMVESDDGGKTAHNIDKGVHVDHHAIWIDPQDPQRMILGNDGGVYVTTDGAKIWRYLDNLPIEQFYQVADDGQTPYTLCGGLQDNNGWCGPSNNLIRGGITGADWYTVVGGDGEYVVPARGTNIIYADSQSGHIQRVDNKTGVSTFARPYLPSVGAMKPADLKYRFNWTSPIAVSATDPKEVYIGGNVLFKSTDSGGHWTAISPDLTRNDKSKQLSSGGPVELDLSGAETYDTILSLSISPLDPKVMWVGTDDGLVQLTKDGGQSWNNVTANMPSLPEWGRVQQIEASPHAAGTAYVAVDFHEVDDNRAFVYKTSDFGKTWTSIAKGLPADEPARVIRENPNKKGWLVVGTETGLFYSVNDGASWTALKSNFPTVPIYDIKFVKKTHDLVVATHGRGLFVLDNITPLEEMDPQSLSAGDKSAFHLFSTQPATFWHVANRRGGFNASGFVTPNPPNGAVVDYYLPAEIKVTPEQKKKKESPVKIVVTDGAGQLVRTMYGPSKRGLNRATWNLRYDGPKKLNFLPAPTSEEENPFFNPDQGPPVLPGTYKVAVTVNGNTQTQQVEVVADPRLEVDMNAFRAQVKAGLETRDSLSALNEALNRVSSLHKQIATITELLSAEDEHGNANAAYKPVLDQAKALDKKLTDLEAPLYNHEIQPGASDRLHFLERFHDKMQSVAQATITGYAQAPNDLVVEDMTEVHKQLETTLQSFNQFISTEVAAFNKVAAEHGSSTLFAGAPIELKPAVAVSVSAER